MHERARESFEEKDKAEEFEIGANAMQKPQ